MRQFLFLVTGLYFEMREARGETNQERAEAAFVKTRRYYELSYKCPDIESIDCRLFKFALKQLRGMPLDSLQSKRINRMLSRFYVKQKSVSVIFELCNDDPQVHHILHSFLLNQVIRCHLSLRCSRNSVGTITLACSL